MGCRCSRKHSQAGSQCIIVTGTEVSCKGVKMYMHASELCNTIKHSSPVFIARVPVIIPCAVDQTPGNLPPSGRPSMASDPRQHKIPHMHVHVGLPKPFLLQQAGSATRQDVSLAAVVPATPVCDLHRFLPWTCPYTDGKRRS